MGLSFLPKQDHFFDLFERQADLVVQATVKLREMLEDYDRLDDLVLEIKELEHEADQVTHSIYEHLDKSFVTPIDPEDIHKLASYIDDVIDEVEATAARFQMFSVTAPTAQAKQLSRVIEACARAMAEGVRATRDVRRKGRGAVMPHLIEINDRESEADNLTRNALTELFSGEVEALDVIRWQELYTRMEHATDRAEQVSHILESICVKNA